MRTRKYSEYECLTCSDPYLYPSSCANENDCFYDEYEKTKREQPKDYESTRRMDLITAFLKFLSLGLVLWMLEVWLSS